MPGTRDAARPPASPASGSPTLVASKLSPPSVGQASIKAGLLEKVAEGAQRRLLLVSAPAGYGKSTLIAEAAGRLHWTTAWYKLDVLDHDPIVLVASLTEAIRRQVASFGEVVIERLSNSREVPITVPELLALFVHELEDEVKLTLHLVLDDYHEASASRELNKALDFLLANLPGHVHVVLLTRFEPSFSTAKLRLDDDIAELRYEDLRLDAGQIRTVFKLRADVEIPVAAATRLEELTEGWPASVVLACKALQWDGLPAIEVALGDPRLKSDVFSYLAEQVYQRESDETRGFLKRTSCLDYVTAALANEITGGDHAERILDYLEKNQVFTFADAARLTYRYHPLFRDYLRQKCAQEDGAREFHDLQLKTASVMERAGDTGVAVEIYLSANEPTLALDCLAKAGELALENSTLDSMRSWLARLPNDMRRGSVWALLLAGQIDLRDGRFDEAIAIFRSAEASFAQRRDRWGRYHAASAIESALFWKGDTVAAAAECRRAIKYAPDGTKKAHSLISLGAALMLEAQWAECESLWSQAEEALVDATAPEELRIACMRAYCDYFRGYFLRAAEEGRSALTRLREHGPRILEASFLNVLGNMEMHLGRYREAEELIRESLGLLTRCGFHHLEHMTLDSLGQVLVSRGDFESGYQLVKTASEAPQAADDGLVRALTLSHMGTACRRTGNLDEAHACYKRGSELVSERFPYPHFTCLANLHFTRGLQGDSNRPFRDLHAVAARSRASNLEFVQLKCDFFTGVLSWRRGNREAAIQSLEEVVESQLERGHVHFLSQELCGEPVLCLDLLQKLPHSVGRSLLDTVAIHPNGLPLMMKALAVNPEVASAALESAGSRMPTQSLDVLLHKATRSRFASVRRLAGQMASKSDRANSPAGFLTQLTKREREILSMMAEGMRNDEIAKRLFLAPGTVKTHVNRIFGKVGVTDRVHAVLLYRESASEARNDCRDEPRQTPQPQATADTTEV